MDANANGTVTKEEFIDYLRSRPQIQNVMYSGLKPGEPQCHEQNGVLSARPSSQAARAMGIKRIITVYKNIDKNRNGVATWDEFIDFFRRTSLLLVYSTPNNPRDRMAAVLADEYQRRQVVTIEGQQSHPKTAATEGLSSKWLIAQKQQQLNAQWATEKFAELQEQSSQGRDALSIVQNSVDALKKSARRVVGRPAKQQAIIIQTNSTAEAPQNINKVTESSGDPPKPSPTAPNLPLSRNLQTTKQKVMELEAEMTDNESKPSSAMPLEVPQSSATESTFKLPTLLQSLGTPPTFSRKGRSHSNVCHPSKVEQLIQQMTPRKTPSRPHTQTSGRTPRRAFTTSLVCQSRFSMDLEM